MIITFHMKMMNFLKLVKFIKMKIRDSIVIKQEKVQVLLNYWNRITSNLQFRAYRLRDDNGLAMVRHLMLVPLKVKLAMFREYIERCRLLHAIAFLQWRKFFNTKSIKKS